MEVLCDVVRFVITLEPQLPRVDPLLYFGADSPGRHPASTIIEEHFDTYYALAERAMRAWEAVANVKFIEVADNDHSIGLMRVVVSPNEWPSGGRFGIRLNSDRRLSVYMHEIGHHLALDHPFYDSWNMPDLFPKDLT